MRVEIEGQPPVEFPDGTDPAVIDKVVKRDFVKPAEPSIWDKLKAAVVPAGVAASPAQVAPVAAASPPSPQPSPPRVEGVNPSALEIIQRMKGVPVGPGMAVEPPRGATAADALIEAAKIPRDVARSLPAAGARSGYALASGAEHLTDLTGDPGGVVQYAKDFWARELEATRPKDPSMAFKVGENVFGNIAPLALAVATKNPSLALGWGGGMSMAERRGELRDKGYSPVASTVLSWPHGMAEAIGEKYGLDVLLKPAMTYGTRALVSTAVDVLGENVTTGLQDALAKVSDRPKMSVGDFLADLWETTKVSAVSGPAMAWTAQLAHKLSEIPQKTPAPVATPAVHGSEVQKPTLAPQISPVAVKGLEQAPALETGPVAGPASVPAERRQAENAPLRKKWGEMSPEEQYDSAHRDYLTKLKNRRAWDEDGAPEHMAVIDLDGFGVINKDFDQETGDKFLQAVAVEIDISGAGDWTYRPNEGGDELLVRGKTPEEVAARVAQIDNALKSVILEAENKDGTTFILESPRFSHGTGKDYTEAGKQLVSNKLSRERSGERVKGSYPRGMVVQPKAEWEAARRGQTPGAPETRPAEVNPPRKSVANLRFEDYQKSLDLPSDFTDPARHEALNRARAEHRRDVQQASEAGETPEGLKDYPDLKKASPLDRQYLANAADAVRNIESDNIMLRNDEGEAVRSNRSYSTREQAAPWLPNSGYTHAEAAEVLDRAARGEMPPARNVAQWQLINDALDWYKAQADNAKFRKENPEIVPEPERLSDNETKARANAEHIQQEALDEGTELYGFPGPVGKYLRKALGINDAGQMKWVERMFDWMGEHIDPEWKNQMTKFFRTPAFYVEEHPEAEPLFERNLERGENNHRDNRFIFDENNEVGTYAGIGPILALTRKENKTLSNILVRGDRDRVRYTKKDLKAKFPASYSDRVAAAYEAAREMIERLQSVIIEKRQEIALTPYEKDQTLHDKLSRVMADLIEIEDAKDRADYMERLTREQAGVLDHQTKVALNRVALHVEGIHEDIARFAENPGYIPRVREEGSFHVRAIEHMLTPDESKAVFGAIMYGRKARTEFTAEKLKEKFGITGKAAKAYKDALEEMRDDPILSRSSSNEDDARKAVGKIVDRLATREVWMEPVNTYFAATRLKAKAAANPGKHFPENYNRSGKYEFTIAENKKLSEEVYADIGNPAAREAIIERAVLRAEAKGAISVADAEAITDQILGAMTEEQLKRGAGKSFLQRSENLIEGYQVEDLDRVMTSHITGMVGYLNKALYSVRALRDMEGIKDPNVQRWANKYYKNSLKNSGKMDQWIGKARGLAVFYRLGGVVKTMVQNSFQQAQTGWSEMARHAADPGKLLATAEKDVLARHLTAFDKKVLEEGIDSGQVDAKYMREISGATDLAPERGFSRMVDVSMKGFGIVETEMNRKPAILAAMRLFTGQKNAAGHYYGVGRDGKPYSMGFDEAMKKAKKFVRATHYEISRANEPEVVQDLGPIARGAYTFQSFTANQLNWLFNRARHGEAQVLGRFMLVTWAIGGLAAAPFSDEIDEALTKLFGVSMKHKVRVAIRESLKNGRDLESLIMNGLPAYVLGIDMSKSVQLNTPLPIQVLLGTDKNLEERASGAIGGLVVSGGRAVAAAGRGDFGKAAEYAAPNAVGNFLRAGRLYREGATTMHGKEITDEHGDQLKLTGKEAVGKALGFQPERMSRYQEANTFKYNLKDYWDPKREKLLDRYRNSRGDQKARDEVTRDIAEFNADLKADKEASLIVDRITPMSKINAIMNKPGMKKIKERKFTEEMVQ
jgi:GGDEF domain-containing protein